MLVTDGGEMIGNVLGAVGVTAVAAAVVGRQWRIAISEKSLTPWRREALLGAFQSVLAVVLSVAMPSFLEGSPFGAVVSLAFFVGLVTAIFAWQVDGFVKRQGVLTLRSALPRAVRRWIGSVRSTVVELWRNLTSNNWSEVRPEEFTTRRFEGLRGFIGLYVVLFILALTLGALGLTASVLMSSDPASESVSTAASLNVVLIAAHAVLAVLMLAAILALGRLTNVIKVPLSPAWALRGGAEAVGWGTAAGALFGALIPLLLTFEPLAFIFGAGPEGDVIYEPSIIVELTAIGAVGGLLVGAAMMPSLLLPSAENLLVRRVIGPLLYIPIILVTSLSLAPIGKTGRQLLDMNRPLLGIDHLRCEDEVPAGLDFTSQSVVMDLVDRCGSGLILPDSWVAGSMLPLVIGIAVLLIVNDVKQRVATRGADALRA